MSRRWRVLRRLRQLVYPTARRFMKTERVADHLVDDLQVLKEHLQKWRSLDTADPRWVSCIGPAADMLTPDR